jgi:hypothetical protein
LDRVDRGEVVVLGFAELEEAGLRRSVLCFGVQGIRWEESLLFAHLGRVVDQKVNYDIACAGL